MKTYCRPTSSFIHLFNRCSLNTLGVQGLYQGSGSGVKGAGGGKKE